MDGEMVSQSGAAQEAREAAAARMKATVPEDRPKVEVPEHLQSWSGYASHAVEQLKEQAGDLWRHPESIVGAGPLGEVGAPLLGTMLRRGGPRIVLPGEGAVGPEELARIQQLRGQGLSFNTIGERMGLTRGQISGALNRAGLSTPRVPTLLNDPDVWLRAKTMRSTGSTYSEIAAKLGVPLKRVEHSFTRGGGTPGAAEPYVPPITGSVGDPEAEKAISDYLKKHGF